jgi:hypothetical protein
MHRCAARLVALVALCAAAAPALAQVARQFPATALRGEIFVTQPPELLLGGQRARLAPGARIRGMDNLLHVSGTLAGQRLVVHYTLDLHGQLMDVWVLNAAELARRPWPVTPDQARAWSFDHAAQRWSPP